MMRLKGSRYTPFFASLGSDDLVLTIFIVQIQAKAGIDIIIVNNVGLASETLAALRET